MEANKETAQKVVNVFVKTLKWMNSHSPEEIAAQMPKDYYAGELDLYVQGLREGRAQYSPDGMMPQGAPESVLKVLSSFSPNVQGKTIDLSKTYTTEFVIKANANALRASSLRGAKRRSNPLSRMRRSGLLRFARNDG